MTPGGAERVVTGVREVVNAHDPEGLLASGCPPDEYEPEIQHFARLILAGRRITGEVVVEVWGHWFGAAGYLQRHDQHERLAADLRAVAERRER
ncbi:hypothetical protein SAMN05421810_104197 [Amycolatopsis arida]|uniref:Uncharacterized protein n=1 Tax=Amycolatopsis arida TaxID=587909 RepID=A0A1I5V1S4_9PSEU|nr:hypothetical protein [Amycolatopsis arida]TDX91115.1 hypothetical protein CLV69_106196 [Amycolatopsis arida]SFQ01429.1 hypothetical protein SAMN05421810_104197 [Amycolatopsis arida]